MVHLKDGDGRVQTCLSQYLEVLWCFLLLTNVYLPFLGEERERDRERQTERESSFDKGVEYHFMVLTLNWLCALDVFMIASP